ncbi:aryl hydrocarbon receptor nuclear translocator-like protein 1 [Sarotherodon galilaeus]
MQDQGCDQSHVFITLSRRETSSASSLLQCDTLRDSGRSADVTARPAGPQTLRTQRRLWSFHLLPSPLIPASSSVTPPSLHPRTSSKVFLLSSCLAAPQRRVPETPHLSAGVGSRSGRLVPRGAVGHLPPHTSPQPPPQSPCSAAALSGADHTDDDDDDDDADDHAVIIIHFTPTILCSNSN